MPLAACESAIVCDEVEGGTRCLFGKGSAVFEGVAMNGLRLDFGEKKEIEVIHPFSVLAPFW